MGETDESLVLITRQGAWGLPTACPACLPSFLYLKLAAVAFRPHYTAVEPDSEDLPAVEYGELVGFSSEEGGIVEFLRREKVVDLDAGLSEAEKAELESYKAVVESWIADASTYEIWVRENEKAVREVYFSGLPGALIHALDWKQRHGVMQRLGITPENRTIRSEELYRKAANGYQALSVRLQDQKFFFDNRPTSLDALVLGHLLFHLRAPLAVSVLKEEIGKHGNLISYAEALGKELLVEEASSFVPKAPPPPPSSAGREPSGPGTKEKAPKKPRTDKENLFRKRAKYFVIAQFVAVVLYVIFAGIDVEEGAGDDADGDDD